MIASLTGVLDVSESFAGFAHPLIFLFLGSFGLAAALSKTGIGPLVGNQHRRPRAWEFSGHGIGLIYGFPPRFRCGLPIRPTVALMLPVALGILSNISIHCDMSVAARASTYLLLGIAYSASIGGMGNPHWHSPQCHRRSSFENGFYPVAAYRLTRCDDFTPPVVHSFTLTYQPG